MMEFTLSRVVLAVCGILLLGAVIAPFTASEDYALSGIYQEETEEIACAVDTFYDSTQRMAMIDMGELLMNNDCSLSFDGRMITLNDGKYEYTAFCEHPIEADQDSYGSNDLIVLTKNDGKVIVHKIR